jgi:2-hydroxychromene-2-carboxylate isomerase
MSEAGTVEFFFDLGSPWTYVASTQIDGVAARTGALIQWRPFLLGGVFKATGNRSPFLEPVPSKLNYQRADMAAWIEHTGIPFNFPSRFPPNTLLAMRGAVAADRFGRLVPYARAGFRAYFVDDEDISEEAVVLRLAERAGVDADDFRKLLSDPGVKETLKRNSEEAVARGAFGAPTFFWGGRMFFGNDRLALLEAFIRRHLSAG